MSTIRFRTPLFKIGEWTVLRLPKGESTKLPSRGMTLVEGTINGFRFQRELEPDGQKSHWLRLDKSMLEGTKAGAGDTVKLEIEPSKQWPEPKIPDDLKSSLAASPQAKTLWMDITPMARWDWIRWIGATKNPETHKKRIDVAFSKLNKGDRRPCCFNRTECTVPELSHKGVLLEPS